MNPNYVPYSHSPHTQNMLFNATTNNSSSHHALDLVKSPHAPSFTLPSISNFHGSNTADTPTQHYELSGFHALASAANATSRSHYNLWGSGNLIPDQSVTATTTNSVVVAVTTTAAAEFPPQIDFHMPIYQRSLSLSLSSNQTPYRSVSGEVEVCPSSRGGGISSMHGVFLGSKYLKAAQELLDEFVNVDKGIYKGENSNNNNKEKKKTNVEWSSSGDGGKLQVGELSTAQRQELQMKKSKLVSMLDEVELRYRQYHHEMQVVTSSFEQAAGYGASKSYTSLALKTISKQFRSLKDAICSQIKRTSKSLGEDDCLGVKVEGSSRLRFVDHHLRQQRALQQLGMIQNNAWRPQRGLPERAVSVLRAWLFEHFLHPYPKDSDKVMLARQTGLTRSQVSNWFINARVRLWKPMVEEMYLEEIKDQEHNNDNTNRSKESSKELDQNNVLHSKTEIFNNQNTSQKEISNNSNNSLSTSPIGGGTFRESNNTKFEVEIEGNHYKDGYSLMTENENHINGGDFGSFSMDNIGRFNVSDQQLAPKCHGNGVSLTLGLPHNENVSLSSTQHGFLSQNIHLGGRINEMGGNENEFCAINNNNESVDIQNRKRFAAQLLRNFVV
ncbi:BEL1-like homeodomain protein 1 isoform X2 [Cicer arietinum]